LFRSEADDFEEKGKDGGVIGKKRNLTVPSLQLPLSKSRELNGKIQIIGPGGSTIY
jgi:hypothetical protein